MPDQCQTAVVPSAKQGGENKGVIYIWGYIHIICVWDMWYDMHKYMYIPHGNGTCPPKKVKQNPYLLLPC